MSPEDLARLHPRLYHVTAPEALPGIARHGLLSTTRLLDLFDVEPNRRAAIERDRRAAGVPLVHPEHGQVTITDNAPLTLAALATCLDDGLTPPEWLALLNRRVFFWVDETSVSNLLGARLNRARPRAVLVLDTLSLARAHADRVEISPINSGATMRRPARRGLGTFTRLSRHDYATWRKLRGMSDRIREVTVLDGVVDLQRHLVEVRKSVPSDGKT